MKAANSKYRELGRVKTGIAALDELLGGGVALGCITEFFGEESVGKSTLALQVIAAAQKAGLPCIFSDTEFTFSPEYASSLGVDCAELDLTQERIGEDTFDAIQEWVESHKGGIAILDSMGGVLAREEAEKTSEGRTIGLQSRLMGAFCRKIIGLLAERKVALIIVNHQVTNLNTGRIGSSGGSKLEHHKRFSVRLTPLFGKPVSRATDGTKRLKYIQAELKKEKGMDTYDGKKVELAIEIKKGFVQYTSLIVKKRAERPAKVS